MRRQTLIRLSESARQVLDEAAHRTGESRAALIERLILRHLGGVQTERHSMESIAKWLGRHTRQRKP